MIRLDLSYFYRLSLAFAPLRTLPVGDPVISCWLTLWQAQESISQVYNDAMIGSSLRSSNSHATALHAALLALTGSDTDKTITQFDSANITALLDRFEVVLQSELAVADAYFVTDKAPFSTLKLISQGEVLFPPDVTSKVPGAMDDLRSAGKCLAFELGTACGFHTMRALEAVLRRYWEVVTGNTLHPKQRNMGVYLRQMATKQCGDPKIIAALTQIKDLHRNEISHPDANLTVEEAKSLLGMARSAAAAMLAAIPEPEFVLTAPDQDQLIADGAVMLPRSGEQS